jgi:hypothetical protein
VQYQVPIRIRDGDQVSTKEKQLIALLVFIVPPVSSLSLLVEERIRIIYINNKEDDLLFCGLSIFPMFFPKFFLCTRKAPCSIRY